MTGATLYTSIRSLLRDDSRGKATAARHWEDAEIGAALHRARADTYKMLVDRRTPFHSPIVGSVLCDDIVATNGLGVPVDFYDLECGMDSDSRYLADEDLLAEAAFGATILRFIAVRARTFRGAAAARALVWKLPTVAINNDATVYTDFPDAFYNTIKYAAMRDLVKKEYGDNDWRYSFFDNMYKRRVATLR